MHDNPFPALVPCHRVIRSDGSVGGYAYGTEIKGRMLSKEGVRVTGGKIADLDSFRHRF